MLVRLKEIRSEDEDDPRWRLRTFQTLDLNPDQTQDLLQVLSKGLTLDLSPRTWTGLMETLVDQMETSDRIRAQDRDEVLRVLLLPHSAEEADVNGLEDRKIDGLGSNLDQDLDFGWPEAALVLCGGVSSLQDLQVVLVRLQDPVQFQSILKVPVRVLVLVLGQASNDDLIQIGLSLSSLLQDQVQTEAVDGEDLLRVLGQCLDSDPGQGVGAPLRRSGTLFGGLLKDLRHRYPQYGSDLRDALNSQCLAAVIFIYFAALSPAVTFGGLMGEKTEGLIGVSELIIATSLQGLVFAVLGAQPLLIVGFSGPLLVFEEALFKCCRVAGADYLTTRLWVGLWLVVVVVVTVALDGSVLVRHVSRFTQEIFSVLISLIFIYETFVKLLQIFLKHPLKSCSPGNITEAPDWWNGSGNTSLQEAGPEVGPGQPNTALLSLVLMFGTYLSAVCLRRLKNSTFFPGTLRRMIGDFGVPLSICIMVLIDFSVKDTYTQKLSVPSGVSVSSPEKRAWLVPLFGAEGQFPLWMAAASAVPALLAFILLFMESQITALIVSRRVVKGTGFHADLLIIVLVGGLSALFGMPWLSAATVRSVTHANALSITDTPRPQDEETRPQQKQARPRKSKPRPDTQKPRPQVIEQRVTGFVVALLVGLSVFVAGLLRQIPVAVLFGVFLYMGVMSLQGVQLTERITLLLTPPKHHPRSGYTTQVQPWRMHLFTAVQLLCLAALWVVMATPLALAFPVGVLLTVPLRKLLLPLLFTPQELQLLDSDGPPPQPQPSPQSPQPPPPQDEYEQLQVPV